MRIDFGDVYADIDLRVKGQRRVDFRWKVGVPYDSTPEDRQTGTSQPNAQPTERVDFSMDLQADKKVDVSAEWTDEVGNATQQPADASITFSVSDPNVLNLTDNGDGTATLAATGNLGTCNVHIDASGDGQTLSGDAQVVVVAGLAERVNLTFGEPSEVTPDDQQAAGTDQSAGTDQAATDQAATDQTAPTDQPRDPNAVDADGNPV